MRLSEQDRDRQVRSDDELIQIADALTNMTEGAGWHHVLRMVKEKRKVALEALATCDPSNIGQVARLQGQAHESHIIPRMVKEAIHRGERARERAKDRARRRGGDA